MSIAVASNQVEQTVVIDNEAQIKLVQMIAHQRSIAVNKMGKIHNRGMSKWFKRWAFFTMPERRLEFAYRDISRVSPLYNSEFASKVGAVDTFAQLIGEVKLRTKALAFKKII